MRRLSDQITPKPGLPYRLEVPRAMADDVRDWAKDERPAVAVEDCAWPVVVVDCPTLDDAVTIKLRFGGEVTAMPSGPVPFALTIEI